MSQSNPILGANLSGLNYRTQDNSGKQALLSHHKGSSAPSYAEAGVIWLDDSSTPWKLKFFDGSDWITLGEINTASNTFTPYLGTSALSQSSYVADTGTANTYAIAPSPAIGIYATGQVFFVKPANSNTGASTLNVNTLGAKSVKMLDGTGLPANAVLASGIHIFMYDGTNFVLLNPNGRALFSLARGTDIASASTVDVGASDSDYIEISGSATVTSLGSTATRNRVCVKFQGILTLTHNATSLILPTGANITTAAGDIAEFVRISGSNWQCLDYRRADGTPLATAASIPALGINPQSSGYTVTATDQAKIIDFTGSSDATFSFTAVATLSANWWCIVRNNGTSDASITLDPNGSEQVDGLTSYKMYPREARLIQCDGTKLTSVILQGFIISTTSSFTFTKPPGYKEFQVNPTGAGGSGGRASLSAGGGGGGASPIFNIVASLVGATETVTVGAGGLARTSGNGSGNAGGNTTFGSLATGYGGAAGPGGNSGQDFGGDSGGLYGTGTTNAGVSGKAYNVTADNAPSEFAGGPGGGGSNTAAGIVGGNSFRGGAGGAGSGTSAAAGGTSNGGGGNGGGSAISSNNASAGATPGGGGGASKSGNSGAGGNGKIVIRGIV